jgi:uncharacterized protein YdaU (DUF1376 family)
VSDDDKAPAFQLYARDFLADPLVDAMEPEELGGYFRLLLIAWQQQDRGYLPNDTEQLARWSKLGRRWKKHGPVILACFRSESGGARIYQKRMVQVAADLRTYREQQAARGRASGEARRRNRDATDNEPPFVSGSSPGHARFDVGSPPVGTEREPNTNSASASAISSLSPAHARVMGAFQRFGVLTPDGYSTAEVVRKVEAYAEAARLKPDAAADLAMDSFDRLTQTWPVKHRTPSLFLKHWEAIQGVMGGVDPTPRQNSRAPPEPKQRAYEDMGDVAKRIGGDG